MVFSVDTLDEALERLGNLEGRDLILLLWVDTNKKCKPIVKPMRIVFPRMVKTELITDIINAINSKSWILAIIDEHKNPYRIVKAEEFAKKSCEGILKDVREKGKQKNSKKTK